MMMTGYLAACRAAGMPITLRTSFPSFTDFCSGEKGLHAQGHYRLQSRLGKRDSPGQDTAGHKAACFYRDVSVGLT
jgi:hypothetical protein